MDTPDHAPATYFSQPIRQILSMVVVLGLVALGARLLAPKVASVFLASPYLNGFIGLVFVIGVLSCFWQVYQVAGSVRWLRGFVSGDPARVKGHPPRLLAPLATLLRARPGMMRISSNASRSILDSVATRIDESRDITRYIVNLLIFLGLLGTFYGLATTVPALVETIRGLAPRPDEEGLDVFNRLMSGLEAQLGGMGIAFTSSLLGLAGSLVAGLLELFAGHGQNRFYRELEEWLSTITRVGFSSSEAEASGEGNAAGLALEQLQARLDLLDARYGQSAEAGAAIDGRIAKLADAVEVLAGHLGAPPGQDVALSLIADGQERMIALLERGTDGAELTRVADGQERLIAQLEERARSPELERIAEGQERLIAHLEERARSPELERIADGQERLIAHLEERARSPELERIAEGQERLIAHLEERARSPELARIAEGQERLVAHLEERARAPELERIAEGQERLVAHLEERARSPELERIAEGQERLVSHLEERARSPELARIAEGQARMVALLEESGAGTLDAESRMHLRSIDAQLLRLLEEMAAGRQEAVDDLRAELAQLSRLVRQLSTGRRPEGPTPIVGRRG